MGPIGRSFDYDANTLVALATTHGFVCTQDSQGRWRIGSPPTELSQQDKNKQQLSVKRWSLQQEGDRWLLSIEGVPQIWFRVSEAVAFILRWQAPRA